MREAIGSSTDQFRSTPAEWRGAAEGGLERHCSARVSMLNRLLIVGFFAASFAMIGCSKKQTPAPVEQSAVQPRPKSDAVKVVTWSATLSSVVAA